MHAFFSVNGTISKGSFRHGKSSKPCYKPNSSWTTKLPSGKLVRIVKCLKTTTAGCYDNVDKLGYGKCETVYVVEENIALPVRCRCFSPGK